MKLLATPLAPVLVASELGDDETPADCRAA
jgi:hypothetical protein